VDKPFAAYRGELPYIFVCYAHEDSDSVYPEISWLHDQGVRIWYDEGISPGLEWTEALASAIQGSAKVLFFVTPRSVTSEHCRRELNFAQEEDHDVVAVHLADTEIPPGLRLSLNNRQAILRHELSDDLYRQELMQVAQTTVAEPAEPVPQPSTAKPAGRRTGLATAVVAAVAVIAGSVWWLNTGSKDSSIPATTAPADSVETNKHKVLHNSIAVLPFDNLSPDPNNAYFAAGIHEEILNQLAKIKDLSVIARTTMIRYADSNMSVPEIGNELKVGTVMEGSVRYAGRRVRITAQLIDAVSGTHLWSAAYEEDLEDIFGIQLEIATRIADTLEAEFSPAEKERIASRATTNPDAYAYYLQAKSSWGDFAATGSIHEALDAAIILDPRFATALAFKAWMYGIEASFGQFYSGAAFDANAQQRFISLAEHHARRSLELDDEQALAHAALSLVHLASQRWQAASQSTVRAYALNPSDYMVLQQAGWDHASRGKFDEGVRLVERAVELNPADVANIWNSGQLFYWLERWEDAKRQASLVTTLAPDASFGYAMLAQASAHTGDSESVRLNGAMAEARNPTLDDLKSIALAYGRIGDLDAARRIFDLANAGDESTIPDLGWQFSMHMAVKEYDTAVSYLERAIDENFPIRMALELHYWTNHPEFDPVRAHPMFDVLVQRAGMPIE